MDPHGATGPLVAGLDIGGTKIAAGVVDETGNVLARGRRETPHRSTAPSVVEDAIVELVEELAGARPVAAVGIYEMSHRREQGFAPSWADAFSVVQSPARGAIMVLSLVLLAIFLAWLAAAYGIYIVTLGPQPPASALTFLHDVFATGAGWSLIGMGVGVGGGQVFTC